MNYIINDVSVDANNYFTITANVSILDASNTIVGSVITVIPPVFITPAGWKNTTDDVLTDYQYELVETYKHNWSPTLIATYKNNNQQLLDNLTITSAGFLSMEELDLILRDLLNE